MEIVSVILYIYFFGNTKYYVVNGDDFAFATKYLKLHSRNSCQSSIISLNATNN